jgi:hypothetical protein
MAYNYFPATYQPYNPYQLQQLQQQQIQQQQPQQIQNGGFVSVRSEDEARNYPVAPGNSVTFRNEVAPYVYTKTMGFSQLDRPVFDKYRLVKEEDYKPENAEKPQEQTPTIDLSDYVQRSELDAIFAEIGAIKDEIGKKKTEKKKVAADE